MAKVTIRESCLLAILKAVSAFASDDQKREHICTVFFELEKSAIAFIATDGGGLATYRARDESMDFEHASKSELNVKLNSIGALVRALSPKSILHCVIDLDAKAVTLASGTTIRLEESTAKFPPYRQVMPEDYDFSNPFSAAMDVVYMAKAARAFEQARKVRGGKGPVAVTWKCGKERLDPVQVESRQVPEMTVILMPYNDK